MDRNPIDPQNVDVVDDRIRTSIAQGEMMGLMANVVRRLDMQFHIPEDRHLITADFVCVSKRFVDSAASQRRLLPSEASDEECTMHDDVHKWRKVGIESWRLTILIR